MCWVVPVLGLWRTFRVIEFPVSWLSMTNTWAFCFPTDVSCSLPHLQMGSLVAALCVSARITLWGWLCCPHVLPVEVMISQGLQADVSDTGSRRLGCWDSSTKAKRWTPLIVSGEKSTCPEPDSSCPHANVSSRFGKTPFKCLFLSDCKGNPVA